MKMTAVTEITNLNNMYWISLYCLNNLKTGEHRIYIILIQNINFAKLLDSAVREGRCAPTDGSMYVSLLIAHTMILVIRNVPFIVSSSIATNSA